jgi:hypothetical protein
MECGPGAPEADVVREDGGAVDVVAVHRVDAVDERDAQPRLHGGSLEGVRHVAPLQRRRVHGGRTASPAQHTPWQHYQHKNSA